MDYTIDLDKIDVIKIFEKAINQEIRSDLFSDIQRLLRFEIEKLLVNSGLIVVDEKVNSDKYLKGTFITIDPIKNPYGEHLGIDFCKKYGVGSSSISALNYYCGKFYDIPSLDTIKKFPEFSFGNFIYILDNENFSINVQGFNKIKIVGLTFDSKNNWSKSYLCFFGLRIKQEILVPIFEKYLSQDLDNQLDEIKIGYCFYPTFFTNRTTGKIFCCTCFKDHINWQQDFYRFNNFNYENEIQKKFSNIQFKDNICHLCTGFVPENTYPSDVHNNSFSQRYAPYFYLNNAKLYGDIFANLKQHDYEVELREKLNYPKIPKDNKWISETILFKIVTEFFKNNEVVFHYRGKELNGFEIDIWIPHLKLGIEYQGIQHYKEMEHWGGKKGLGKRRQNDYEKQLIFKELGYSIVYFDYSEFINRANILNKIWKYIDTDYFQINASANETFSDDIISENWTNLIKDELLTGDFKANDLYTIRNIILTAKKIKDYKIKEINTIQKLKKLEKISIQTNKFEKECSKLSFFSTFQYLRELKLPNNNVKSLKDIEKIKLLTKLELKNNSIKSLTPIKKILNLQYLDISSNKITDIEPLRDYDSITHLDISNNQINTIAPIIYNKNLKYLKCSGNSIPQQEYIDLIRLNPKCKIVTR